MSRMQRSRLGVFSAMFVLGVAVAGVGAEPQPSDSRPDQSDKSDKSDLSDRRQEASHTKTVSDTSDLSPYQATSASPKTPQFTGGAGSKVVVATLEGTVDLGVAPYLQRAIEKAEEVGAAAFIVEMNTPGGRVDAALQIRDILLDAQIPTIVWIHREAISAGALIAYAHDYILWSAGGTMGAATPIQMSGGEAEQVDEKVTSFMRGAMRATAEAKGRDGKVAEAMVDKEVNLPPYAKEGWLLTVAQSQARQLGLWDGDAESLEQVLAWAGLEGAEVIRPEQNWAESVARVLTDPIVSSILMSIGVLGILIEFYTPGFGMAGIVGVLSLLVFFAGHLVVRLVGWEEMTLVLLGGVLLAVEILIIPGFGVAGVLGILALLGAFLLTLLGVDFSVALDLGLVGQALFQVMASLAIAGAVFIVLLRYLPSLRPVRKLVLSYSLRADKGVVALNQNVVPEEISDAVGVTLTNCRPVGKALLGGRKLDVHSQGEIIPKGTDVRVVRVEGPRIVVEPTSPDGVKKG